MSEEILMSIVGSSSEPEAVREKAARKLLYIWDHRWEPGGKTVRSPSSTPCGGPDNGFARLSDR